MVCSKYRTAVSLAGMGIEEGGRKGKHDVSSDQTMGVFIKDKIRNLYLSLNGMKSLSRVLSRKIGWSDIHFKRSACCYIGCRWFNGKSGSKKASEKAQDQ